jgi:ketosteroid isomerase-like protein
MSQRNVEIVQQLYASFGRGDIPAVLNGLAEDVEWCQSGPESVFPFSGPRRGKNQMMSYFQALGQSLNIQVFEPREFIAHDDKVIVLGHEEGEVKPTGRKYKFDWIHVFTLREGKVVQYRDYYDTAALEQAFRKA